MTTLVGIFAKADDMDRVRECSFDTLDFLPSDSRLLRIEVPILTIKEIRDIERQLPLGSTLGPPERPRRKFQKILSIFPKFRGT